MKIVFGIILLWMCSGCHNKRLPITIYSSVNDSIFYYEGDHFDTAKLFKGVTDDPAFFDTLVNKLNKHKEIFYKPLNISNVYGVKKMMDFLMILSKRNINNVKRVALDSDENVYFNYAVTWKDDMDVIKFIPPVNDNASIGKDGKPFLYFVVKKDNTICYKYDSSISNNNLKVIFPGSLENIKKTLEITGAKYNLQLNETGAFVILNDKAQLNKLMIIKAALLQENVHKCKMVINSIE